ncbi:LysE family translocator [Corynebacterium provencense]|uniref:LysE family translocator n=1 Tax=Corynebacterium provencense TaxID=1737425 RepID=UPI000832F775|nr:LysE family translocator [Corynebacterium provencense]
METALVLQFALTAGIFAVMPGADWAYAITAGLRTGSVVPPVLGLAGGYIVEVTVIAGGVGAVVSSHPDLLTVLTVVGATYIVWLGVTNLLELRRGVPALVSPAPAAGTGTGTGVPSDGLHQFLRGMGVSGINPKGLMLLLALLPQFLTPGGWHSGVQMALLGGIFVLEILVVYSGVAVLARSLLRSRPRLATAVTVCSGIFLTGFGTWMLLDALL